MAVGNHVVVVSINGAGHGLGPAAPIDERRYKIARGVGEGGSNVTTITACSDADGSRRAARRRLSDVRYCRHPPPRPRPTQAVFDGSRNPLSAIDSGIPSRTWRLGPRRVRNGGIDPRVALSADDPGGTA